MHESAEFKFLEPGPLFDGELELVLARRYTGEAWRNWVPWYEFEMRVHGSTDSAGRVSFRVGNNQSIELYGGHIGYQVDPLHRGRHYAERSVRLLFPFIKLHGFKSIWMTCNPDNAASRRTCERLGARFVDIVPLPPNTDMFLRGEREKCRYRLEL
jgi:tagatose 1,6-diphosphate aldolase